MLKLKESGRVRHVGVSNLNAEQLSRVCAVARPACLQVPTYYFKIKSFKLTLFCHHYDRYPIVEQRVSKFGC